MLAYVYLQSGVLPVHGLTWPLQDGWGPERRIMELILWLRCIEASPTDICLVQFAFLINSEFQRSSTGGHPPAVGGVERNVSRMVALRLDRLNME